MSINRGVANTRVLHAKSRRTRHLVRRTRPPHTPVLRLLLVRLPRRLHRICSIVLLAFCTGNANGPRRRNGGAAGLLTGARGAPPPRPSSPPPTRWPRSRRSSGRARRLSSTAPRRRSGSSNSCRRRKATRLHRGLMRAGTQRTRRSRRGP